MTIHDALEYQLVNLSEELAKACIKGDRRKARLLIQLADLCGQLLCMAEHRRYRARPDNCHHHSLAIS